MTRLARFTEGEQEAFLRDFLAEWEHRFGRQHTPAVAITLSDVGSEAGCNRLLSAAAGNMNFLCPLCLSLPRFTLAASVKEHAEEGRQGTKYSTNALYPFVDKDEDEAAEDHDKSE